MNSPCADREEKVPAYKSPETKMALASLACRCVNKQVSLLKASSLVSCCVSIEKQIQAECLRRTHGTGVLFITMKTPKYDLSILRLHKTHQRIGSII